MADIYFNNAGLYTYVRIFGINVHSICTFDLYVLQKQSTTRQTETKVLWFGSVLFVSYSGYNEKEVINDDMGNYH